MNPRIVFDHVSVEYPLMTVYEFNLKRQAIRRLTSRARGTISRITALRDCSFSLTSGDRVSIVGGNGAGKTTLLRAMSGSLAPTKGRISIHGRVLSLLGGPDSTLEPHLTGKENIMNLGVSLGETRNAMKLKLEEIIEFSGLGARIMTPVATYSSGMASRLRFATITALSPQVLIVDEGIGSTADRDFVRRARDRLKEFQRRIEIIAWSSHNVGLGEIETRRFELSQGVLHEKFACWPA